MTGLSSVKKPDLFEFLYFSIVSIALGPIPLHSLKGTYNLFSLTTQFCTSDVFILGGTITKLRRCASFNRFDFDSFPYVKLAARYSYG